MQVGEWLAVTSSQSQPPQGFLVGVFSSAPFILWLVYGGYWTATGDLSADRYPRLGAWTVGGLGVFLLINVALMVALPPDGLLEAVSWVRWASAIGGGSGLGLAIVRQIVEAHGWTIRVTDAGSDGGGARFEVTGVDRTPD